MLEKLHQINYMKWAYGHIHGNSFEGKLKLPFYRRFNGYQYHIIII